MKKSYEKDMYPDGSCSTGSADKLQQLETCGSDSFLFQSDNGMLG